MITAFFSRFSKNSLPVKQVSSVLPKAYVPSTAPNALTQDRFELRFQGQVTTLGEAFEIPDAVLKLRSALKYLITNNNGESNASLLAESLVLCTAHGLVPDEDGNRPAALGVLDKASNTINAYVSKVLLIDDTMDLAFIQASPHAINGNEAVLPLAKQSPDVNETVYVLGNLTQFDDTLVFPTRVIPLGTPKVGVYPAGQKPRRKPSGEPHQDGTYQIQANFIDGKKFIPYGLSGGIVVNKDAELVGMITQASVVKDSRHATGVFRAVNIETIRKSLMDLYLRIKSSRMNDKTA